MGVITYMGGEYPAFLTFQKYTWVFNACVEAGTITEEDRNRIEGFYPETDKRISYAILGYLRNLRDFKNKDYILHFYNFFCSGEEAKDNLSRLLEAAVDLYRTSKTLNFYPQFGFIPTDSYVSPIDIRFPFGKNYWFVSMGLFQKIIAQVLIESDKVEYFCGNLHCFHIVFDYGMQMEFDHGQLNISPRFDIGGMIQNFREKHDL